MEQALSIEQVNAMCAKLLPLADKIFDYMSQLEDAGFAAFVPHRDFVRSFGASEEDQELHRLCLIEGAKNRLARPMPLAMTRTYGKHFYFSPLVQQLLDERDRVNGVPEEALSSRYPGEIWRREVDPCERRKLLKQVTERESYESSWSSMLRAQRERFRLEADQHATGLATAYSFDPQGRYAFYRAVMEHQASALGFHINEKASRWNYPLFSRAIGSNWELCWTIDDALLWGPMEGYFQPHLGLWNRRLRGRPQNAKAGEVFFIGYNHIVPGFGSAYWKFQDLDELETTITAHLYLYRLMSPIIDGALASAGDDFSR